MYERFTDRARKVMRLANAEAQRFRHEFIGTEHVLLGLVKEGTGVGANVLKNLNVDLRAVRMEVEKIIQAGPELVEIDKLPKTPRVKRAIECAIEEARGLDHNYVGSEHLLLGLLREGEGVAAVVLVNLGLSLASVRDELRRFLGILPAATNHPLKQESESPPDLDESVSLPPRLRWIFSALSEATEVLRELKANAVARSDFEWAADLRDQEGKLRKMKLWLQRNKHREPPPDSDNRIQAKK